MGRFCTVLWLTPALAGCLASMSLPGEERASADDITPLRPLDMVGLWVYKQPDLSADLRITPDGFLVVPVVGRVKAAGRGTATVAAEIRGGLETRLKLVDPIVSLAVKEYAPQRVYLSGGVRTPMEVALPLDRPMTLGQALAVAGGLTDDALPGEVRIVRQRPGQTDAVLNVNYLLAMRDGRMEMDLPLRAGDSVYVPQLSKEGIFVVGGVMKPGYVDLASLGVRHEGLRPIMASQVLSMAEGLAPTAMPKDARILRPQADQRSPQVIPVDFDALISQGAPDKDRLMQPGDTLFVPQGQGVFVLGQVERGGNYYPPAGGSLTVTKAISMAGGFTRLASSSSVRLIRKDSVVNVDVDSLTKSSSANDPALAPGDIIFVPRGL